MALPDTPNRIQSILKNNLSKNKSFDFDLGRGLWVKHNHGESFMTIRRKFAWYYGEKKYVWPSDEEIRVIKKALTLAYFESEGISINVTHKTQESDDSRGFRLDWHEQHTQGSLF